MMYRNLYQLLLMYYSILSIAYCSDDQPLDGHMQPIGSHMAPILINITDTFPDPLSFYNNYVKPQWPVIFRGLILTTDAYKNWQSDSYLLNKYGDAIVGTESGKKENRSGGGLEMTFKEFLNKYNTSDIYLVSDMPDIMKPEWSIPNFLLCGGYMEHLSFVNMWFSSGGTKSVLHTDTMENFHCVVSGRKEFVIIEPHYSKAIGPEHERLGYYYVDVEKVDMTKYPNISKIPWYKATINAGDCLYLPYMWIHHVASYDRNFGVNVWWTPFEFDEEECKDIPPVKGFAPIDQFEIVPEIQIKGFLLGLKRNDGTIHSIDAQTKMSQMNDQEKSTLPSDLFDEVFEILVPGCNGVIHEQVFHGNKIPVSHYKEALRHVESKMMEQSQDHNYYGDNSHEEGRGDGYPIPAERDEL